MAKSMPVVLRRLVKRSENVLYRIAGLPITIAILFPRQADAATLIRRTYAQHYWSPEDWAETLEIGVALCIWPVAVLAGALYFTWRNGTLVASRSGIAPWRQLCSQLRLSVTHGILPPWYYIFALHDRERLAVADSFLNRCETKRGVYPVLARKRAANSPLDDKLAFAEHCSVHQLPHAAVLATAHDGRIEWRSEEGLPPADLFVKPISACGGTGAERWDYVGDDRYARPDGVILSGAELVGHLARRSIRRALLIQPQLHNDPALADLNNGALATVRVLTCLDENERPEIVGAVFRMAVGANRTVDNLHAGGIASQVDPDTGELSPATNLGMDARLGWQTHHPDTGAQIAGRLMPQWNAVRMLAERAHSAFRDRVLVGWDIAALPEGPCLVEGNSAPDVDVMQRHGSVGLCRQRFGTLLAWHLASDAPQGEAPASRSGQAWSMSLASSSSRKVA